VEDCHSTLSNKTLLNCERIYRQLFVKMVRLFDFCIAVFLQDTLSSSSDIDITSLDHNSVFDRGSSDVDVVTAEVSFCSRNQVKGLMICLCDRPTFVAL